MQRVPLSPAPRLPAVRFRQGWVVNVRNLATAEEEREARVETEKTPTGRGTPPDIVARNVLIAIGLTALAYLIWQGRQIVFVLFFGVLVGVFFSAFTGWLARHGLPRLLALGLVLLVAAALTAGFWILLWPVLSEQLSTVSRDLPQAAQQGIDWIQSQYRSIAGEVGEPDSDVEQRIRSRIGDRVGAALGGALPIINSAMGALAGLLLVLVVGIYTAARPGLYRKGFLRLVPPPHRDRVAEALDRSEHSLRRWMIGTLINMVVVALLVFLGLWILDMPAAVALAVIAGLFEFVPIIGPILAALPAMAVALTVSPVKALWVALLYVVIQQVEGDLIMPVVMRGAARLPPALTVLFQAFMAVIFGFLGLLLAVPILAVVMVMVETLYLEPIEAEQGG